MYDKCSLSNRFEQQSPETTPFGHLEILMSQETTLIQKKTAFKVLQRYFRNIETKDASQGVNLDADLMHKLDSLEL